MQRNEIVRRETVEALVRTYEQAEVSIRQGCALIAGAEKGLTKAFSIGGTYGIDFRERDCRSRLNYDDPSEGIAYLREQIWRVLVERLEVRRMMSLAKSKELSTWLEKESHKEPITSESVLGFFRYYVENLENMLEEQVGEVYDFLRPRHDRFKTNTQYRLGPKVILTGWVGTWRYDRETVRINHYYSDHFVALENVFLSLDGRGSISKSYRTELEQALSKCLKGETTYFKYRAHKKGTLHLEFLREDLVQRFNEIAGRRFLGKGADDAAA